MATLAYGGSKNFGFLGTVQGKKMFFRTHVEDQSLRGPLLKALKPVCKNQGGWGAPHLLDIKRVGGWGGHLSHLHQLWHIFIEHLSIDH